MGWQAKQHKREMFMQLHPPFVTLQGYFPFPFQRQIANLWKRCWIDLEWYYPEALP